METTTAKNETGAAAFARDVIDASVDINDMAAAGGAKTYTFGAHYIDLSSGVCGIKQLIHAILSANGCVHPAGAEKTGMRQIVVAASMFYADIESEVRKAFCVAGIRYPHNTLRVYLANSKNEKDNKIVSVQLLGTEDTGRTSPKPRAKYYLAG